MTTTDFDQCVYGQWLDQLKPQDYKEYQKYLAPDSGVSATEICRLSQANGFLGGLTALKVHRKRGCICFRERVTEEYKIPDPFDQAKVHATQDEINVENVIVPNALAPGETGIFDKVFEIAKLDKNDFRLVDDSVTFSTWNQSANVDGRRDLIVLYSYKCRFVRVSELRKQTELLVEELAESARQRRLGNRRIPGAGLGEPCSFTFLASDWQLGKPEIQDEDLPFGKTGVEQTIYRVERALDRSVQQIKNLRAQGMNLTGVAVGFMGDPTENISDSYTNQAYTIELNLIDQIERALDLSELVLGELLGLSDDPADVWAVLCNHGQLSRRGTKTNITDDSDNVQNLLMRILKDRIIGPAFPGTNWYLPDDQMITTLNIAGVPIASAHGHKIPSGANGEMKWLASQSANLSAKRGHRPELWLTAHRHSHDSKDYGPYHRLQSATADGGSKHFEDGTGGYSTSGTSTVVIGRHDRRRYSNFELF